MAAEQRMTAQRRKWETIELPGATVRTWILPRNCLRRTVAFEAWERSPDNADRTEAIPSRSKVRGGNRCPQAKWHKIKPSFTPYWRDAKLGILNKFISPRSPRRRSRQLKAERRACRIHRRYLGRQRAVVRLRDNRRDLLRAHVGCRQTRAIPFDGQLCHKVGTG